MDMFVKYLNLQICQYWYILCPGKQTETHMNQPTKNP